MSLIGPVLLEEKKENARANLKDQLATLKDEEWDRHGECERRKELRSQVDSERRRHDRMVEEKSWVVCCTETISVVSSEAEPLRKESHRGYGGKWVEVRRCLITRA